MAMISLGGRLKHGCGLPGARVKHGYDLPGARLKHGSGLPGARLKHGYAIMTSLDYASSVMWRHRLSQHSWRVYMEWGKIQHGGRYVPTGAGLKVL